LATCIQHEIDHLNGILFIDYLSKLKKDMIIKKLIKQKKFLFRTAASFISSISEKKSFSKSEIFFSNLRIRNKENSFLPGLIIVGSYVELSTIQLNNLLEISNCNPVELDVFEFFKITSSDNNQKRRNLFKNKFLNSLMVVSFKFGLEKIADAFQNRAEELFDSNKS